MGKLVYPPLFCGFTNHKLETQKHVVWEVHMRGRKHTIVGPILLKNPLGAGWGLLPTLRWVASWFPTYLPTYLAFPVK